jgi:hypothetical protein
MEIKFRKTNIGSLCYYVAIDENNNILPDGVSRVAGDCHGMPPHIKIKLLFEYNNVMVSEDEFNQWLEFCSSCVFKSRGLAIEEISRIGYRELDKKFYSVILHNDDYVTRVHLFAAVTVIRMISYRAHNGRFVADCQKIINNVCNLIEKNPNEDPLKLLLIAHRDCLDYNHFLIHKNLDVSDITSDSLAELFKSKGTVGLNNFFSTINPQSFKSFKEIIW